MWISSKRKIIFYKLMNIRFLLLFKFAPSMQTMLTFLLAGLATYHETYNRSIPYAAASLATAPKYILFPEQRAKKVYS
jgi:hypothetical protein